MDSITQIDLTFPLHCECQVLLELPNQSYTRFYYPGANKEAGRDGLLVKVVPQGGEPWIGCFGFGDTSGPTKVYSSPQKGMVCVVSRGDGYIVSVEDPTQYERVKLCPILGAYPVSEQNLIVFHNFTDFVAYGVKGLAWRSKRISYDGIKVDRLEDGFLFGQAWDAPTGKDVCFRLDLRTGIHEGGSYPSD